MAEGEPEWATLAQLWARIGRCGPKLAGFASEMADFAQTWSNLRQNWPRATSRVRCGSLRRSRVRGPGRAVPPERLSAARKCNAGPAGNLSPPPPPNSGCLHLRSGPSPSEPAGHLGALPTTVGRRSDGGRTAKRSDSCHRCPAGLAPSARSLRRKAHHHRQCAPCVNAHVQIRVVSLRMCAPHHADTKDRCLVCGSFASTASRRLDQKCTTLREWGSKGRDRGKEANLRKTPATKSPSMAD